MKIGASVSIAFMDHDELKRAVESGRVEAVVSHTHGLHKRFGAIAVLKPEPEPVGERTEHQKRISEDPTQCYRWSGA